jgi:hypothetical protein
MGPERLQGDFAEVRAAKADVLERDTDLIDHVRDLAARTAATAAGMAVLDQTNAAMAAATQAALAAVGQLSAKLQHQATHLGRQADELENQDLTHARRATTLADGGAP